MSTPSHGSRHAVVDRIFAVGGEEEPMATTESIVTHMLSHAQNAQVTPRTLLCMLTPGKHWQSESTLYFDLSETCVACAVLPLSHEKALYALVEARAKIG